MLHQRNLQMKAASMVTKPVEIEVVGFDYYLPIDEKLEEVASTAR